MPVLHAVDAPPALHSLRAEVCGAAARFDAGLLDRDAAIDAMSAWAAIVHAGEAGLAMATARVAECGPPPSAGASSAVDFVAKQTGVAWEYRNVRIAAGYEVANWFGLIDGPQFLNDFAEGKIGRRRGDLSLEGLFVQLGVAY